MMEEPFFAEINQPVFSESAVGGIIASNSYGFKEGLNKLDSDPKMKPHVRRLREALRWFEQSRSKND